MKKLLLLLLLMLPMMAYAHEDAKKYYIYNIFSFSGNINSEELTLEVDNGVTVEKLKDGKGKKVVFRTPAAALMYLISQGWEMYMSGSTIEGGMVRGYGSTDTSSYWIMRKECSKELFEHSIKVGRKSSLY